MSELVKGVGLKTPCASFAGSNPVCSIFFAHNAKLSGYLTCTGSTVYFFLCKRRLRRYPTQTTAAHIHARPNDCVSSCVRLHVMIIRPMPIRTARKHLLSRYHGAPRGTGIIITLAKRHSVTMCHVLHQLHAFFGEQHAARRHMLRSHLVVHV